jgi:hypothetical protein
MCGTGHSVCLSRTRLSVGKDSYDALGEKFWQEVLDLILVDGVRFLVFGVGVVKLEFTILDVFCDAVYLDLGLVNRDFGIQHTDCVNLTLLDFF